MTEPSLHSHAVTVSVYSAPEGPNSRFSDLSKRILSWQASKETFRYLNPANTGPWMKESTTADGQTQMLDDYETFKASLITIEEDVRIYSIDGHGIKLVLKESYALVQDEIRRLRLMLEDPPRSQEASQLLAANPYAIRALPEDFLPFIDELPDSSYFTRFLLLDDQNVEDFWVRQVKKNYNSGFISSAAVEGNGDLLFFKREIEEYLRTDLFHEWNHRLASQFTDVEWMFQKAVLLEGKSEDWYVPSAYALTDFAEHWAVYGERMIASPTQLFEEVWRKSPLRAVIWMRAFRKMLNSRPTRSSTIQAELMQRCKEVEELALPNARSYATRFLEWQGTLPKGVASPAVLAKELLAYL